VAAKLADEYAQPGLLDQWDARARCVGQRDLAPGNPADAIDRTRVTELGGYGDGEAHLRLGVGHGGATAEIQRNPWRQRWKRRRLAAHDHASDMEEVRDGIARYRVGQRRGAQQDEQHRG